MTIINFNNDINKKFSAAHHTTAVISIIVFMLILLLSSSSSVQAQNCPGSGIEESQHKKRVKNFFTEKITTSTQFKEARIISKVMSNNNNNFGVGVGGSNRQQQQPCTLTRQKQTTTFPVYSAHHLGITENPSPFHVDSYKSTKSQVEVASFLDKFVSAVEDSIPIIGAVVKVLRTPIVMVWTHAQSVIGIFKGAINRVPASEIYRVLSPQTLDVLRILDPRSVIHYRINFFRQVIDVNVMDVKNNNNKNPIAMKDGVVNIFAVSLPPGAASCSEVKDIFSVKHMQGVSKSVSCRAPGTIDVFHSPVHFVNSIFGWIPSLFTPTSTAAVADASTVAAVKTCSVDTNLLSAEPVQQCIVVTCASAEACSMHSPQVEFVQRIEIDVAIPVLLIFSFAFAWLRPYASSSALVRWVLCTMLGLVVFAIMLALLVWHLIKDNNTVKFGVLIGVGVSGLWAATSGLIGHIASVLVQYIFSSPIAFGVFALLCFSSVYLAHRFFGSSMPTIINFTMIAGEWFFKTSALLRNVDFCATLILYYVVFRYLIVGFIFGLLRWIFGASITDMFDSDPDRPRDRLPSVAREAKPDGTVPVPALVNRIGYGATPEQRTKMYDKVGDTETRKHLQRLYDELNQHPEKYANKLMNPNSVFRQAMNHKKHE